MKEKKSNDRQGFALIPNRHTIYNQTNISHANGDVKPCLLDVMVKEFGCDDTKWQTNPRCMIGGEKQREDDWMLSFNLPPSVGEAQLAKTIIAGFFGPKGITLEKM